MEVLKIGKLTHKLITRFLFKKPFYGKSLISDDGLKFVTCMLEKLIYENVKGDVIECGVYRGGSLVEFGNKLKALNSDKTLFGLDTFEGHPYTDEGTKHVKGHLSDTSYEKVKYVIDSLGLNNVTLIKGKFSDTFPSLKDKRFCFAFVDCNLYQSVKECLHFLMPRMNKGGIIFIDDYYSESPLPANKAVEEFIDKKDLVILPKQQAYYYVKD